jgi:hypothetical protein
MGDVSGEDVEEWSRAMSALWGNEVDGTGHERAASEAAANLMSSSGLLYVPSEVLSMLTQAIEVGYANALRAVENGDYDGEIRHSWRTDLFE